MLCYVGWCIGTVVPEQINYTVVTEAAVSHRPTEYPVPYPIRLSLTIYSS
jgi:hypothetical protein